MPYEDYTFVSGLITSAIMNKIRDNFRFLYAKGGQQGTAFPSSVAGDIFTRTDFRAAFLSDGALWRQISVGDFTGGFPASPITGLQVWRKDFTPARLYQYDGSAWYLLIGNVSCNVYNSANITLTTGVQTTLTYDTEISDTDNIHSTSSNTGRLTCPLAGNYDIHGIAQFASNTTGYRELFLVVNNATVIADRIVAAANGQVTVSDVYKQAYPLAAGDYVEMRATQNSGGNLAVQTAGVYSPSFSMKRVS